MGSIPRLQDLDRVQRGLPRSWARAHAVLRLGALLTAPGWLWANEAPVPAPLQAELLIKVASYDGQLAARARGNVRVLIVTLPGKSESARVAAQLKAALGESGTISGMPHTEEIVPFASTAALAAACKSKRAAVIYFTPGFTPEQVEGIRQAFEGVNVLTVSGVAAHVQQGIVVGFDLVSGRPVLLANVRQAAKQNVVLSPNLLRLMTVYR